MKNPFAAAKIAFESSPWTNGAASRATPARGARRGRTARRTIFGHRCGAHILSAISARLDDSTSTRRWTLRLSTMRVRRWSSALLVQVCALVVITTLAAHAQTVGALEFTEPDGFRVLRRGGVALLGQGNLPREVRDLSATQGIDFIAARFDAGGTPEATFQVMFAPRSSTFTSDNVEAFATEIAAQLAPSGPKAVVRHKDVVTIAGRSSARVALVATGRRMLIYAVPDGSRTVLLLYAAGETLFPTLYPSFERSAFSTTVAAAAAVPTGSASEDASPSWAVLAGIVAAVVAVLALGLVFVIRFGRGRLASPPTRAGRARRRR